MVRRSSAGLVTSVVAMVAALLVASPAEAAPSLDLNVPARGFVGSSVTVRGTVGGTADPSAQTVDVARRVNGGWRALASGRPDAQGRFSIRVPVSPGRQTLRVRTEGPAGRATATTVVTGVRRTSFAGIVGPRRVTDGRPIALKARWRTADGMQMNGRVVVQEQRTGTRRWRRAAVVRVRAGVGTVRVRPRHDTRYRTRTYGSGIATPDISRVITVDNRPPGPVFKKPSGAPAPRIRLRAQRRAYAPGAQISVQRISNRLWRSMRGRSWHRGCPVGRSSLRLVRTNYYSFDGYPRRGEIVVAAGIARPTTKVFRDLYRAKLPIRSLYRVDRFGWSRRLNGADDLKSMAADNSSGFNCRSVVGSPGSKSPHSTGRSIDLNPWENPYRSGWGILPNSNWDRRSAPRPFVYRSSSHPVVRIMARHGFRWLGSSDWQHFQYVGGSARTMPPPATFLD